MLLVGKLVPTRTWFLLEPMVSWANRNALEHDGRLAMFFLLEACQWRALGGDLRGPLNIQIKTHVGMDAS